MTSRVPTLAECLHAAENMPLRTQRTRAGTPTGRSFQFQVRRNGRLSTGRINPARAGALVIAGDGDTTQVNPALLRASELQSNYIDTEGDESFSEVASYLALQMLRADWRRDEYDVVRDLAEDAAARMRRAWWSVEEL